MSESDQACAWKRLHGVYCTYRCERCGVSVKIPDTLPRARRQAILAAQPACGMRRGRLEQRKKHHRGVRRRRIERYGRDNPPPLPTRTPEEIAACKAVCKKCRAFDPSAPGCKIARGCIRKRLWLAQLRMGQCQDWPDDTVSRAIKAQYASKRNA